MQKIHIFLSLIVLLLLCSCQQSLPQQQYTLTFSAADIHFIEIKIQGIPIEINPSKDASLHFSYSDCSGEKKAIEIVKETDLLTVSSGDDACTEKITISFPAGQQLEINAFNTDFDLNNLNGNISIDTVDGDINAQNVEGKLSLHSARGNITATNCHGDISIFGEHGSLSLNSLHGEVNSSNVVGDIQFSGQILAGDDVFLETDHGEVTAALLDSDQADLNIRTTNGTTTCMLDQVKMTNITCTREPASPVGNFKIKTIWGAIRVGSY